MLTNLIIKNYRRYECGRCEVKVDTLYDATVEEKKKMLLDHIATHWFHIPNDTPEGEKLDYFKPVAVYIDGKKEEAPMID